MYGFGQSASDVSALVERFNQATFQMRSEGRIRPFMENVQLDGGMISYTLGNQAMRQYMADFETMVQGRETEAGAMERMTEEQASAWAAHSVVFPLTPDLAPVPPSSVASPPVVTDIGPPPLTGPKVPPVATLPDVLPLPTRGTWEGMSGLSNTILLGAGLIALWLITRK